MQIRNILVALLLILIGISGYFAYSATYLGDSRFELYNLRNIPYLNSLPIFPPDEQPSSGVEPPPVVDSSTGVEASPVNDTPEPTAPVQTLAATAEPTAPPVVAEPVVNEPTSMPAEVDQVVVLMADPVTTFDPHKMVSTHPAGSVSRHLWDSLTRLNQDLAVEPYLAESWRIVNNFTWEFQLRENITFHNGEPVDAEAVRFSIERPRNLPGSLETFAHDINLAQVEVVDALTVRIITAEPVANVPFHLALLEIVPPVYYGQSPLTELAKRPIGSGPYQTSGLGENREIVLDAAPTYWRGTPSLSRIIFRPTPAENERVTALLVEDSVIATDLPPVSPQTWKMGDTRLEMIESTRRLFIGMNIQPEEPLANLKVRQALNYAVNVDEIVENWFSGDGRRYGSWVNPPHQNPDLPPWPYDPELARSLLTEAGYTNGFTTTLAIPLDLYPEAQNIGFTIAQQLAAVGVTVQVEEVEWPIYLRQLLSKNKPPLFLLSLNSHGDALEDIKNLSSNFRFNPVNWHDDIFEDALRRAINTLDDDIRQRRILTIQEIAYQQAPWIWLWRPFDYYGVSNSLDWSPRADGIIDLYTPSSSDVP